MDYLQITVIHTIQQDLVLPAAQAKCPKAEKHVLRVGC